jgi:hypothetical protein
VQALFFAVSPASIQTLGFKANTVQLVPLLQRPSWAEYLNRLAGPTLIAACLVSLVREPNLRMLLKQLVVACFISAFAVKEIADFPAIWKRAIADYRSKRAPLQFLSGLIAPEPIGWLRTLARLLIGFWRWATCPRHGEEEREGLQFTYLKRSVYGVLMPLAVLALLVDVPVSMFLLPAFGVPESHQFGIRSAIFLGGLLTLACLLGDRWYMSTGKHSLTNSALLLRISVRFHATIPRRAILVAMPLSRTEGVSAHWSKREIAASPFDRPNIRLILTEDACVEATSWGCTFHGVRCIYVYVDEPHVLLAQLRSEA